MHKAKIAVSLILLVLSIPINSSFILGQYISSSTQGKHGIKDILSRTDYLEITANLSQPVNKNNVRTNKPAPAVFDECHDEAGTHVCMYTSGLRDWTGGKYPYTLTIDDGTDVVDSLPGVFHVDDRSPVVQEFNVARSGDRINFSFKAKDTACNSCQGICAGLSVFSLLEEDVKIWDTTLESCVDSGKGSVSISSLAVMDGTAELCARVSDRIEQKSAKVCRDIYIDTVAPEIFPESFRIVDGEGNDINHISDRPISATVKVDIKDSDLRTVRGDFSNFNSVSPGAYKDIDALCSEDAGQYSCIWDIVIDGVDGTVTATIYAEDKDSNSVTHTKGFTITEDTNKPKVISLHQKGIFSDNNTIALREDSNNLVLELENNGAGFNKSLVFLDMGRFGTGNIQAKSCKLESVWICEFIASVSKQHGFGSSIFVQATSDVGNIMTDHVRYDAVVDARTPVVGDINISPDCGYAGQDILVELTATDDHPLTMTVDASSISTRGTPVTGRCQDGICTATITDLVTDHTRNNIEVNITDLAGNRITKYKMVEVCEEDSVTVPNLITLKVNKPAEVDKRLLSFIGATSYIPMIIKTSGNSRIVSKQVSCSDTKSVHLLNAQSMHPSMVIKLNKATVEGSSLNISCQMEFIMRKGTKVYSQPEVEEFSVKIPLLNNALGEITDSMQSKIDSVKGSIDDLEDDIEKWEKYNTWLNLLCSTAETMARLNSVLQGIKSILWGILVAAHIGCKGTYAQSTCESAITKLWGLVCKGTGWYNNIVEKFVWPTGYDFSPDKAIGNIIKYGCMLYSCRICDWSTHINVGASIAATAINRDKVVKIDGPRAEITATHEKWIENPERFRSPDEFPKITYSGDKATITQTLKMDFKDAWLENSKRTYVNFEPDSSTWIFDPYRSIHYAKACLCLPGYVYNLKKERQIKCMYKTCLEQNAKVGLPTDSCEYAYKERECLYVDGAQYKEHGFMGGFLDNLWDTLIANLPGILLGIAYAASCGQYRSDSTTKCEAPDPMGPSFTTAEVLCALMGVAVAVADIVDFIDGGMDFSRYDPDLGGTDYCSGGG